MSTSSPQGTYPSNYSSSTSATAWSGWVIFAATMMVLIGGITFIEGLVALFNAGYYGSVYHLLFGNYTAWGWWNMILGAVIALAGFALFTGSTWARVVGIVLASLSALAQLVSISVAPVWSVIVIGIDVVVIYALAVNQEVA